MNWVRESTFAFGKQFLNSFPCMQHVTLSVMLPDRQQALEGGWLSSVSDPVTVQKSLHGKFLVIPGILKRSWSQCILFNVSIMFHIQLMFHCILQVAAVLLWFSACLRLVVIDKTTFQYQHKCVAESTLSSNDKKNFCFLVC